MASIHVFADLKFQIENEAKCEVRVSGNDDGAYLRIQTSDDNLTIVFNVDQLSEVKDKIDEYLIYYKAIQSATAGLSLSK